MLHVARSNGYDTVDEEAPAAEGTIINLMEEGGELQQGQSFMVQVPAFLNLELSFWANLSGEGG